MCYNGQMSTRVFNILTKYHHIYAQLNLCIDVPSGFKDWGSDGVST